MRDCPIGRYPIARCPTGNQPIGSHLMEVYTIESTPEEYILYPVFCNSLQSELSR